MTELLTNSGLTLTQWTLNTDNFTSMKKSFCDTSTLRKQKLPLPVPITLQDIHIKSKGLQLEHAVREMPKERPHKIHLYQLLLLQ